ncbi:hypothetical protein E2C06_11115 [Dankookia rubra]|uniref:Calcium-binding protein n=1 Tax=Dankookia rubra TaxID=1442381 RepID=A0A4R5QH35_9PROT|nr:FG-GAP-like repeat-containing protein [Dankookia rubra]TDH62416.1 hypothetical protein E2C06_11115 [Dankookia rubra]
MTLIGDSAGSTITGGLGSDLIVGGGGLDILIYDGLPDGYDLTATFTALGSGTIQKRLSGTVSGTDTISGISVVAAGAGHDLFDFSAASGPSSIDGPILAVRPGAGDDIVNAGGLAGVELDYSQAGDAVSIRLQVELDADGHRIGRARDGDGGVDTLIDVLRVRGSDFSDRLIGGSGDDTFLGSLGGDTLLGAGGSNSLDYAGLAGRTVTVTLSGTGTGIAVKSGGGGTDRFIAFGVITGTDGADSIKGFAGTTELQVLRGMGGADTIDGANNLLNLVDYSLGTGRVSINLGTERATDDSGSLDVLQNVLHVRGSAYDDLITGSGRGEYFDASLGSDTYAGGGGTDTLSYAGLAGRTVTVRLTADGAGTVAKSGGGADRFAGIHVIEGTAGGDILKGFAGATQVTLLRGLGGIDSIDGAGNVLNVLDYSGSVAIGVNLTTGVAADGAGSYDMLYHVRAVVGSRYDDVMVGSADADVFHGSGGNDSYTGNAGLDTLDYGQSATPITLAWTGADAATVAKGAAGGTDSLTGIERVVGSAAGDSFTGHAALVADTYVSGGQGNDTIDAGGSAFLVADYRDGPAIIADLGAGTVQEAYATPSADRLIGVVQLRGSAFADSIVGSAGNDVLHGGAGDDTIKGGAGHDTAVLGGTRAATTLTHHADGSWTATGPDGTDTLRDVEAVRFTDGTVQLRTAERDFDGDGQSDILFDSTQASPGYRTLAQWHVTGGAFDHGDSFTIIDPGWSVAATGDFDGNGRADLLWHMPDGTAAIWLLNDSGTGYGSGGTIYRPAAGQAFDIAGVGDLNGDGRSDILFSRVESFAGHDYRTVSLWQMDGLGGAGGGAIAAVDASWSVAGIGDFDGDGRSDILWRDADSSIAIWRMDGTSFLGGGTVSTPGTDWVVAGVGDFDGDGRSDILFQDGSGNVAGWRMDGTTVLEGRTVTAMSRAGGLRRSATTTVTAARTSSGGRIPWPAGASPRRRSGPCTGWMSSRRSGSPISTTAGTWSDTGAPARGAAQAASAFSTSPAR